MGGSAMPVYEYYCDNCRREVAVTLSMAGAIVRIRHDGQRVGRRVPPIGTSLAPNESGGFRE